MKRLTAKIREAIRLRQKRRRILANSQARQEDLIEAIDAFEQDLARKKRNLRKLRREDRRPERQDALADEIEELEAALDVLYERLDSRKEKTKEARKRLVRAKKRVERLKARRKAIEAAEDRIGKYWHFAEFFCRISPDCPDYMRDDLDRHAELFLDPMREKFGPGRCTSGHRWGDPPPAAYNYNASIGGATGSFHVYEDRKAYPATDLMFERGKPSEWAAYAREIADRLGFGGVGQYASFIHIDPRPYRSDWWG